MAAKETLDFIRIISSQLSEEGCELPEDAQLKEALQNSVSTLPSGSLKDELQSNFNVYFSKLQSTLSANTRKSTTAKGHKVQPRQWSVNTLSSKGLETSLAAARELKDAQEKEKLYHQLVLATQSDQESLSSVLHQWNNDLIHSPPSHSLGAIRFIGHLAGCPQIFEPWLQFCFSVYSRVVVTPGRATGINAVKSSIYSTLMHAHLIHRHHHAKAAPYDDIIAAILSFYIDILSSTDSTEHILSTVLTLLGHSHEHCLDVVLQTTASPSCATAQLLLPLSRKLLSSLENCSSHSHYIKYICCLYKARSLANAANDDVNQFEQVSVPATLKEWIWRQNVSACENMGLRQSWSLHKTSRHLLKSLSSDHVEELLDVATGTSAEAAECDNTDAMTQQEDECLFFLDTNRGDSPKGDEECAESELKVLIGRLPLESDEEEPMMDGIPREGGIATEGFCKVLQTAVAKDEPKSGLDGTIPLDADDVTECDITKKSDYMETASFNSDMDHSAAICESDDVLSPENLSLSKKVRKTMTSKRKAKAFDKVAGVDGTPQGQFEIKPFTTAKKRKKNVDQDLSLSAPVKRYSRRIRK